MNNKILSKRDVAVLNMSATIMASLINRDYAASDEDYMGFTKYCLRKAMKMVEEYEKMILSK